MTLVIAGIAALYLFGMMIAYLIIVSHNIRRHDIPGSHFSYAWSLLSWLFVLGCIITGSTN